MASERQREANRHNGRKGGPKTEAGKERSRCNSLKHGLTSSTLVVLPEEDVDEYRAVLQGFRDSFQPQDAAEDALVLRLAHTQWRSLRSRSVETGILNITAATERTTAQELIDDCPENLNPHNAIAVGFMISPAERWQMYLRYDATISREFFRTLEALTRLQRARQLRKPAHKPIAVAVAGAQSRDQSFYASASQHCETYKPEAAPALSGSGIRSVSQNDTISPEGNEQKEHTYASKEQKTNDLGRASRIARPVAQATQNALNRLGREEGHLRRLLAIARVLPGNAPRPNPGNHYWLGQHRKRRKRPGLNKYVAERKSAVRCHGRGIVRQLDWWMAGCAVGLAPYSGSKTAHRDIVITGTDITGTAGRSDNPATGGSGMNVFTDPQAALSFECINLRNHFQPVNPTQNVFHAPSCGVVAAQGSDLRRIELV